MTTYRASPCMTCSCPSRAFPNAQDALQYAREAADAFRVAYGVHRVSEGKPERLQTIEPDRKAGA